MKLTIGGFIEAAGTYRNLYTGSDVNSKWNLGSGGFPLPNSPNYYMDELRGSARQSRLSLLAQGQEDHAALAAYFGSRAAPFGSNRWAPRSTVSSPFGLLLGLSFLGVLEKGSLR